MPQVFDFQAFREKVRFGIDFGRVLGRVWGGFGALLTGFQGFQDESNFEAEIEPLTGKSGQF